MKKRLKMIRSLLPVFFFVSTFCLHVRAEDKKKTEIQQSPIRLRFTGDTTSKDVNQWVMPGGSGVAGNVFIFRVSVGAGPMGMSPIVAVDYGVPDCSAADPTSCTWAWALKARIPDPKPNGMDVWGQSAWSDSTSTGNQRVRQLLAISNPKAMGLGRPVEVRFLYAHSAASQMPEPSKLECKVSSVSGNVEDLEANKLPLTGDKITFDLKAESVDRIVFNTGAEGEPAIKLVKPLMRRALNDPGRVTFSYSDMQNVSGISQKRIAVLQIEEMKMAMDMGSGQRAPMPGMDMGGYAATLVKTWQYSGLVGAGTVGMSCTIEGDDAAN